MPDYSKILIVDNADFILMVVRLRLEAYGISPKNIYEASDGQNAYEIINKHGIKNILSDYEMKPMDGIELAAKLLLDEKREDLRFVLFSGTPMEKIMAKIDEYQLKIPILTKTTIRENWSKSNLLTNYFPELSASIKA
ncbi:MAG: response regulator [Desulfobulbaceae bacterium]|nr:response regulator [Desulfobulbaceae bacterium]HIJ79067.1 response regulator [Deltaproteobacteria bacterium]